MCLAIPAKIIKIIDNEYAIADFNGVQRKISIQLVPEIKVNEFCIVHAGFAIEKVSKDYVKEIKKYLKEIFHEPNSI